MRIEIDIVSIHYSQGEITDVLGAISLPGTETGPWSFRFKRVGQYYFHLYIQGKQGRKITFHEFTDRFFTHRAYEDRRMIEWIQENIDLIKTRMQFN